MLSNFPAALTVHPSGSLLKYEPIEIEQWDNDPRGIVWLWEPYRTGESYCMGIDPTVGRTGWSRHLRVEADRKTNNGSIEILRRGRNGRPDVQVAEYASPVDPFELADIANILGRIYTNEEEEQCECIIEVQPGPGIGTMQRLIEHGYTNLWRWQYYAEFGSPQTKSPGWFATPRSNRDLWVKASRHINLKHVQVNSPFLADELADCRFNEVKQYAENPNDERGHGDRVRAFMLDIWAINRWSMEVESIEQTVTTEKEVDWQSTDMTMEEIYSQWDDAVTRLGSAG